MKEIVAEAERLDIKDKAVLALSEVLFDKNMVSQIPKFRALFLRVSCYMYFLKPLMIMQPIQSQLPIKINYNPSISMHIIQKTLRCFQST